MNRTRNVLNFILCLALLATGCSNPLEGLARKDTDEALYEDALKLLDKQDYLGSIEKFEAMSDGFASRTKVREHWAGALAGQCGLNFINYFTQLGDVDFGANPFFKALMDAWTDTDVSPSHCRRAENKIKEIWEGELRTGSQQLFMAILSMAKIGTYLRTKADTDKDGAVDAGFTSCTAANDDDHLTNTEVAEIVSGFSLFLLNIVGFGSSLSNSLEDLLDDLDFVCQALDPSPCDVFAAESVDADMITLFRKILDTADVGVGSCIDPSGALCCP